MKYKVTEVDVQKIGAARNRRISSMRVFVSVGSWREILFIATVIPDNKLQIIFNCGDEDDFTAHEIKTAKFYAITSMKEKGLTIDPDFPLTPDKGEQL